MRNRLDVVVDVAMVTISAIVGTVVLGRALDTDLVRRAEMLPIAGSLITGVRAVVRQVYNP
jgi:ABC-type proline/glycine betaine transport system permease subunit